MAFGKSAENYHESRHSYPAEIFNFIGNHSSPTCKTILDLGCGTGIATVELKRLGFSNVIGCDYDKDMIAEAESNNQDDINYLTSSAKNMPFKDNYFDIITAFGSFHWFCDNSSVCEMKRILRNEGSLFIINKNDESSFRNDILNIASQYCELKKAYEKEHYYPEEILKRNKFKDIKSINFKSREKYDLPGLISLVKSMQFWNHISNEQETDLIKALKSHFSSKLQHNYYERLINVSVVYGEL